MKTKLIALIAIAVALLCGSTTVASAADNGQITLTGSRLARPTVA